MTDQHIFLDPPACFRFFHQNPFLEFVPSIRFVSGLQKSIFKALENGYSHGFRVRFENDVAFDFYFNQEQEAVIARRDLITSMMNLIGADQVVFTKGFYAEVATVASIESITEIHVKDQQACFSAILKDGQESLHFVFPGIDRALQYHELLSRKIEARHRNLSERAEPFVACA